MITHFIFLPLLLFALLLAAVVRLITSPFRHHRHRHWGRGFGYDDRWSGYGGGGYGYRRHRFGGNGLLTVLGLLALERLFGRRW